MEQESFKKSQKLFSEKINLLIPFSIYFFSFLLLFAPVKPPIIIYTIVYISTSLLFIFLCYIILRTDLDAKYVYSLLIISVLLRIAVIPIPPAGSDDYLRYVWDGKVTANGINPYKYAPSDPALSRLHSEKLPSLVKFPEIRTVYPPVAEIFFYFAYLIGGETFYGIKSLLLIFELIVFLVLIQILKKLNLPLKNILYYALCPLPVFQLFIDGHIDGIGASLLIIFTLFYLNKNFLISAFFLGLSICVKPVGLIAVPIIFFHQKGLIKKITASSIPIALSIIFYFFFSRGANPLEALGNFTLNWTFNGFIFNIIDLFISDNQKSRLVCAIIFILSFVPVLISKKDFIQKLYYSVFLLLIFSPIVHPWYVTWLAVLVPLYTGFSGFIYCGLISLTAVTILNYQLHGNWNDYPLIWFLEYLPVLFFFLIDIRNRSVLTKAH